MPLAAMTLDEAKLEVDRCAAVHSVWYRRGRRCVWTIVALSFLNVAVSFARVACGDDQPWLRDWWTYAPVFLVIACCAAMQWHVQPRLSAAYAAVTAAWLASCDAAIEQLEARRIP